MTSKHKIPICWLFSHDWNADPKNAQKQFNYWRCERCGKLTDSPFDVPEELR